MRTHQNKTEHNTILHMRTHQNTTEHNRTQRNTKHEYTSEHRRTQQNITKRKRILHVKINRTEETKKTELIAWKGCKKYIYTYSLRNRFITMYNFPMSKQKINSNSVTCHYRKCISDVSFFSSYP